MRRFGLICLSSITLLTMTAALSLLPAPARATVFTNFESSQVHPLALSADGSRLFACNTPDNRLSVYQVSAAGLTLEAEIPVGLEPISVRPRTATEVWVVNKLSDNISIVDLTTMHVRASLSVGDEPTDVVFAGTAGRAFVCVSQLDLVKIYDPASLATAPVTVALFGNNPRALATNPAGTRVYAAFFESGNRTSVLTATQVVAGGGLPAPNPPMNPALPQPLPQGLVIYSDGAHWVDETATRNWETLVSIPYTLPDYDVVELDADTPVPVPRYFAGVGTLNYGVTVNPVTGQVYVPNEEAFNLTRFEPNVNGKFAQYRVTRVDPAGPGTVTPVHLNPHINYAVSPGPPAEIALSISQPNGGDWDAAGTHLYLAALGSGKLAVVDPNGLVTARVEVGEGPTAAEVDDCNNRVYVLNRFTNTVATVSTVSLTKTDEVSLGYQPEPPAVTEGRRFLYDARISSAHGDLSCGSCHAFGHFDAIVWDLGNPLGQMEGAGNGSDGFHPLKGPMATQSLRGLADLAPYHWRGDRADLSRFNPAFVSLMGLPDTLSGPDMQKFVDFMLTIAYPPNPYQNLDRTYPTTGIGPGNAERGRREFTQVIHDAGLRCQECHQSAPAPNESFLVSPGTIRTSAPGLGGGASQVFKVPHLRGLYEKVGFLNAPGPQKRGFGLNHDGIHDTVMNFLLQPQFIFTSVQQRRDLESFILCFDTGMAPAVGVQQTVDALNQNAPAVNGRIGTLLARADMNEIDLVVKGRRHGLARGWLYSGGVFVSDRVNDPPLSEAALRALAGVGTELTYTGVPPGNGLRIGLDRDGDGWRDRDELDAGTNPADPASFPDAAAVIEPGATPGPLTAVLARPARNPAPASGTCLSFTLGQAAEVSLRVFDARGRSVRELLPPSRRQGTVTLDWNGLDDQGQPAPSGVYFYQLAARGPDGQKFLRSERVVLAR